MEDQPQITFMRVLIEMIDPTGVDAARPPLDSVHLVTLSPAAAPPDHCRLAALCRRSVRFWTGVWDGSDEELMGMSLRDTGLSLKAVQHNSRSSREASLGADETSAIQDHYFSLWLPRCGHTRTAETTADGNRTRPTRLLRWQ